MSLCIAHLNAGGLIVNYRCSSRCRHCLYACSPKRAPDYIDYETALLTLRRIRQLGCRSVHIGGGEPFLNADGLQEVLRAARDAEVGVQYVETNAAWHIDGTRTHALLRSLRGKGLNTLLVSISPFHNEHVPYDKTRQLMEACHAAGLSTFPWIVEFAADLRAMDTTRPHPLADYTAKFGSDYVPNLLHRYSLTLGGRAVETFAPFLDRMSAEDVIWRDAEACERLDGTYHFHVDLYGNYIPGLCAGLAIRLDDLGRPLDPEHYPILTRLHAGGIGRLYRWAMEEHGFRAAREGYVSACHLCQSIRQHLVHARGVSSHELQPSGFYEELAADAGP